MGQRRAGRPPGPKHAAAPRRRAAKPAPKRRLKPRYGRVAVAGSAGGITLMALLGGMGILPMERTASSASATTAEGRQQVAAARRVAAQLDPTTVIVAHAKAYREQLGIERQQASDQSARAARELEQTRAARARKQSTDVVGPASEEDAAGLAVADESALPVESGEGRRAVFDMSAQRAWIVDAQGKVKRTYLVSGSVLDNLKPGTYEVYSRSRHAVGVDDSGEMEYFVRFTRGKKAAIGFHSIPTQDGKPLQSREQLGSPQSHGCIRQARPDAIAMWEFAHIGTKVVVRA